MRLVFVVGSGRSGTTTLQDHLAAHPDTAFISRLSDRSPTAPVIVVNRLWRHLAPLGRLRVPERFVPSPSQEALRRYEAIGVPSVLRDKAAMLEPGDADRLDLDAFDRLVARHSRWMGADTVVTKHTNNSMAVVLWRARYPDAHFVQVVRDPRAVVSSLRRVDWWPDLTLWWSPGDTPRSLAAAGEDPTVIAARHVAHQLTALRTAEQCVGCGDFTRFRYEDLVERRGPAMTALLDRCGLASDAATVERIMRLPVRDQRFGWRASLSQAEIDATEDELFDHLTYYGYS